MMFGKLYPKMYLGVVSGLLDGRHHKRLGPAWMLFEWCIGRQTGQGEEGIVCYGAVVTYAGIADEMNCSPSSVRKWMYRLVAQKYIRVERDRRGLRIFVLNPKKFRLSKPGHSKRIVSAQNRTLRVPTDGHSQQIHLVESAATSENALRNDLTKHLKNNNTTAAAQTAAVSLSPLARKKEMPRAQTEKQWDARRRFLLRQSKEIQKKYKPARGT